MFKTFPIILILAFAFCFTLAPLSTAEGRTARFSACKKEVEKVCHNYCALEAMSRCAWLKKDALSADCIMMVDLFLERYFHLTYFAVCDKSIKRMYFAKKVSCEEAKTSGRAYFSKAGRDFHKTFGLSLKTAIEKLQSECPTM